ncbi:MAG: bifunctional hydroxymethylpyrimidine kinase/phosphomethylpyrimidine kinase [Verrucomicrobiae bacterium]|nr:bifunctional hydroxymethylpyrimidine kinase/phosphomethylpyrimidine kinase [Verrucomicrobiae bacterium]
MEIPQQETPVALTVAGSDSSSGAGLQADLKTFAAHDVYGLGAVTAVVAEIPGKVVAWEAVSPDLLARQMEVVDEGFAIGAAKTGMLATPAGVETVSDFLEARTGRFPVVVDPVMVASSGDVLLEPEAIDSYRRRLLPLAAVATPNLAEIAVLLNREVAEVVAMDMETAARDFFDRYGCPVLVKGGHWQSGAEAVDLWWDGREWERFAAPRVIDVDTHGTGCTLSAAIAANLSLGYPVIEAIRRAKRYITAAIIEAHTWSKPAAIRALNHFPKEVG